MKRILFLLFMPLLVLTSQKAGAQRDSNSDRMEKYKAEKIAYMTANLNLTTSEAQKFWPIYNEFEKERFNSQGKRHDLDRKIMEIGDNITEKEILELNSKLVKSFQDEADVVKKYNEKFLKALPPKKVLMIYKVENQFRMEMIRKFRDRDDARPGGNQSKPGGNEPRKQ